MKIKYLYILVVCRGCVEHKVYSRTPHNIKRHQSTFLLHPNCAACANEEQVILKCTEVYGLNLNQYVEVFLSYNNFVQSVCPEIRTNTRRAKFKPSVVHLLRKPLEPIK